jgi:diguanylate cyclase
LREDLETVRNEAITDGLTGVGNRKFFDIMLRKFADDAAKTGQPVCLLLYDVDHFKAFNDKHGHQIGDQVLRLVARTLKEAVKGGDIVARYGGEEFAIILPKTALNDALTVADQVRSLVSQRRLVRKRTGEEVAAITISAGVALYRPGENLSYWIDRTDTALYRAKQMGRNRVEAEEPTRDFAVNQ